MKDDTLPPLVKITDPLLASVFGCTLATKRSNAENTNDNLKPASYRTICEPI